MTAEPTEIGPTCHYVMGGVEVDADTREPGHHRVAAGELAGGRHGANRLGGNSLSICWCSGAARGRRRRRSRLARRRPSGGRGGRRPARDGRRARPVRGRGRREPVHAAVRPPEVTMNDLVGIIRTAAEIESASLVEIDTFKVRARRTHSWRVNRQHNPGRQSLALDLRNMLSGLGVPSPGRRRAARSRAVATPATTSRSPRSRVGQEEPRVSSRQLARWSSASSRSRLLHGGAGSSCTSRRATDGLRLPSFRVWRGDDQTPASSSTSRWASTRGRWSSTSCTAPGDADR